MIFEFKKYWCLKHISLSPPLDKEGNDNKEELDDTLLSLLQLLVLLFLELLLLVALIISLSFFQSPPFLLLANGIFWDMCVLCMLKSSNSFVFIYFIFEVEIVIIDGVIIWRCYYSV